MNTLIKDRGEKVGKGMKGWEKLEKCQIFLDQHVKILAGRPVRDPGDISPLSV